MNSTEKGRLYYYVKKIKAIEYLGGKCIKCGENEHFKLSFHHKRGTKKENKVCVLFEKRWEIVKNEIEKCELLCFNCHMENHHGFKNRNDKKILLNFKGQLSCEKCGYDKCFAALDFHHNNPSQKEYKLSSLMSLNNNFLQLKDSIENELNKCEILCKNCHQFLHANKDFFEKNKDIIYEKLNTLEDIRKKIDRNVIEKMYNDGMKQIEIARKLNASKSTISIILKNMK